MFFYIHKNLLKSFNYILTKKEKNIQNIEKIQKKLYNNKKEKRKNKNPTSKEAQKIIY